jgi:sulfate transport system permease protein
VSRLAGHETATAPGRRARRPARRALAAPNDPGGAVPASEATRPQVQRAAPAAGEPRPPGQETAPNRSRPARGGRHDRAGAKRSRLVAWGLRAFGLGYVGLLVAVPVGSVVWRALAPGIPAAFDAVTAPAALHALVLTLEVAGIAVACNSLFGLGVAILLARHRFPGAPLLEALIDLPLSLSPVVVGLAITLFWSSTEGWVGPLLARHGLDVLFSWPAIVLASSFISLPYVVREVLPVLQEVGTEQEQAAETLGAGRWYTFRRITLPAIRWGLVYGIVLTAARVLGEFGAVSVVSGNIVGRTQTLTLFVSDSFANFDPAGAYAGALLLALISVALLGLLSLSRHRRRS